MFRAATPDGDSLASCDSVRAPRLRIRPLKSSVPSMASSGWLLGANAVAAGAGAGATLALGNGLYLLAPALTLPISPMSRAAYLIEYKDTANIKHSEVLRVRKGAWFNGREESRREILDASSRGISGRLFGTEYPDRDRRTVRVSVEPFETLLYDRFDSVIVSLHIEKFLPANFTMDFSPSVAVPVSGLDGYKATLYLGPRYYFLSPFLHRLLTPHSGPFIGLQPFGSAGYHGDLYGQAGVAGTTGLVWQGWRYSVGLEVLAAPVYQWGGSKTGVGLVTLGGITVGAAF